MQTTFWTTGIECWPGRTDRRFWWVSLPREFAAVGETMFRAVVDDFGNLQLVG